MTRNHTTTWCQKCTAVMTSNHTTTRCQKCTAVMNRNHTFSIFRPSGQFPSPTYLLPFQSSCTASWHLCPIPSDVPSRGSPLLSSTEGWGYVSGIWWGFCTSVIVKQNEICYLKAWVVKQMDLKVSKNYFEIEKCSSRTALLINYDITVKWTNCSWELPLFAYFFQTKLIVFEESNLLHL